MQKLLKKDKTALLAKVKYNNPALGKLEIQDPDALEEEAIGEQEWRLVMLNEPLLGDCEVHLVGFDDLDAKRAFWHSSAHILGYAIEQLYEDPLLTIGPPTKEGFFYDFCASGNQVVRDSDYKSLEKLIQKIIAQNHNFEKLLLTKREALEMFSYNKFKSELIEKKVGDDQFTSVFKIGEFIDLCTGPHIPSTRYAQAFKVMKHSQAYWLGDSKRESLQRIYGVSFPQKE